jgi:hypothetical protein
VPLDVGGFVPLLGFVELGLVVSLLPLPVTRMWSTTRRLPANDCAVRLIDCFSLPVGQVPVSSICESVTFTFVVQPDTDVSALIAPSICVCRSELPPVCPTVLLVEVDVLVCELCGMFPNGVFGWVALDVVWPVVVLCALTSLCGTVVVELCVLAADGCVELCDVTCALCWLASPIGGCVAAAGGVVVVEVLVDELALGGFEVLVEELTLGG